MSYKDKKKQKEYLKKRRKKKRGKKLTREEEIAEANLVLERLMMGDDHPYHGDDR